MAVTLIPVRMLKAAHDVSEEPRYAHGRWAAMGEDDFHAAKEQYASLWNYNLDKLYEDSTSFDMTPATYLGGLEGLEERRQKTRLGIELKAIDEGNAPPMGATLDDFNFDGLGVRKRPTFLQGKKHARRIIDGWQPLKPPLGFTSRGIQDVPYLASMLEKGNPTQNADFVAGMREAYNMAISGKNHGFDRIAVFHPYTEKLFHGDEHTPIREAIKDARNRAVAEVSDIDKYPGQNPGGWQRRSLLNGRKAGLVSAKDFLDNDESPESVDRVATDAVKMAYNSLEDAFTGRYKRSNRVVVEGSMRGFWNYIGQAEALHAVADRMRSGLGYSPPAPVLPESKLPSTTKLPDMGRPSLGLDDDARDAADELVEEWTGQDPAGEKRRVAKDVSKRFYEEFGTKFDDDLIDIGGWSPTQMKDSDYSIVAKDYGVYELGYSDISTAGTNWRSAQCGTPEGMALMREGAISSIIHRWAETSNDSHPKSLAMQEAIRDEFGLHGEVSDWNDPDMDVSYNEKRMKAAHEEYKLHGATYRAFALAMYDNTQDYLRSRRIYSLSLHRGVKGDPGRNNADMDGSHDVATIALRPASSWSVNPTTAKDFGSTTLSANWPAKRILGCNATGFGCKGEYEVVPLGGASE